MRPTSKLDECIDQAEYFWRQTQSYWEKDVLGVALGKVAAQGPFSFFAGVVEAAILAHELQLDASSQLAFHHSISLRGVVFELERFVLIGFAQDCLLGKIRSIIYVEGGIFLWLLKLPGLLVVDRDGNLSADLATLDEQNDYCLLSAVDGVLTALWDYPAYEDPTRRCFIVKW